MSDRPLTRALDWLTEAGHDLPPETREILLSGVLMPRHIITGTLASVLVGATAFAKTGSPLFLAITIGHIILSGSALVGEYQHRVARELGQPDFSLGLLITSLVTTFLVGVSLALCFLTGDIFLQVLGPVNMMGFVTAAVARNSTMPRLVITQVMLLLGPFVMALGMTGNMWWAVLVLETPLFLLAISASVRRISSAYVTVLLAERESQERARRDLLTGLWNRQGLMNVLASVRQTGEGRPIVLLFIDLDGFKEVNDRHGHAAGDEVLRIVAERLSNCLPDHGWAARIGGDEFVILLEGGDVGEAKRLSQRVILSIALPVVLPGGPTVFLGASVGIAGGEPADDPADILARADAALYRAKAEGRGRFVMDDRMAIAA